MKIRWSPNAADDLIHLFEYIRQDNAPAAMKVARSIRENIATLRSSPRLGRPGRMKGTFELVLAPLPFIVVYRLKEEIVEVVRVLHGTQRWP